MKFYSGLVIEDIPATLLSHCEEAGLKFDTTEGNHRHYGTYWKNPLEVVYDWVVATEGSVSVTYEETVEGGCGSLGDIFTVFNYENGECTSVDTEFVEC